MIPLNKFTFNELWECFHFNETNRFHLLFLYFFINQFAMIENVIKISVNDFA